MSEATTTERKWVDVGDAAEVPEGEVRTFTVEGQRVAVARANQQLYAVQDLCSHDDGPLGEGELEGYSVVCPRHGAKFDVRTGDVVAMPAVAPIESFPVMEKDGRIQVGIKERNGSDSDDSW